MRKTAFLIGLILLIGCVPVDPTLPTPPTLPTYATTPEPDYTPSDNPIFKTATAILPTPTLEFCEDVPIQYRVTANVLNVRIGPGTNYESIGQLRQGDIFTGDLCLTAGGIYYWTFHPILEGWVAYRSIDASSYFME